MNLADQILIKTVLPMKSSRKCSNRNTLQCVKKIKTNTIKAVAIKHCFFYFKYFCNSLVKNKFLKDYYYFLGVASDASEEDIRKAYRKLSVKYHPDKNDDDAFFENRFREVQEAYDTLGDSVKKKAYDLIFNSQLSNMRSALPPVIKSFHVNKVRVVKGEEIIITWNTLNADVVKIMPFGLMKPFGEKRIKITEFIDGKFQLLLQANNSFLNKTIVKGISLTEISESEKAQNPNNIEEILKPKQSISEKEDLGFTKKLVPFLVIAILVALAIYFFTS